MHRPKVALLIAPDAAFTRGVLRGIRDYVQSHEPWSLAHAEFCRGDLTVDGLKGWTGNGVIARPQSEAEAARVAAAGMPTVVVGAGIAVPGAATVRADDAAVARVALQHLRDRKLARVAFVGDTRLGFSARRRDAFLAAADEAGIACTSFEPQRPRADWHLPREELLAWLRELPRPCGVLAAWDGYAAQVLEGCRELEIPVPEGLAVLGVDDDDLICELADPPLSSVVQDTRRIGQRAASLLAAALAGTPVKPAIHEVPPLGVSARRSTDAEAVDDPIVRDAVRLIRERACDGLTVAALADRLAVSRRSLELRFEKLLGRSPHREIRRAQLDRARVLLGDTDLPLADVAERSGFGRPDALAAAFRKEYGQTPGAWRRLRG